MLIVNFNNAVHTILKKKKKIFERLTDFIMNKLLKFEKNKELIFKNYRKTVHVK